MIALGIAGVPGSGKNCASRTSLPTLERPTKYPPMVVVARPVAIDYLKASHGTHVMIVFVSILFRRIEK